MLRKFLLMLVCAELVVACDPMIVSRGGGRLGDRLISLLASLSLAYNYQARAIICNETYLPEVFYKHFPSQQRENIQHLPHIWLNGKNIDLLSKASKCKCGKTIVFRPTFVLAMGEAFEGSNKTVLDEIQTRGHFYRFLQKKFRFIKESDPLEKKFRSTVNIGVHFREGGDFDSPRVKKNCKARFKSYKFYQFNLLKILKKIPKDLPVTVFFFSDSLTKDFVEKIMSGVSGKSSHNIKYQYATKLSEPLKDLSKMSYMDFLVRPVSHFSISAEILGNIAGTSSINVEQFKRMRDYQFFDQKLANSIFDRVRETKDD